MNNYCRFCEREAEGCTYHGKPCCEECFGSGRADGDFCRRGVIRLLKAGTEVQLCDDPKQRHWIVTDEVDHVEDTGVCRLIHEVIYRHP